tara:strand:+ start:2162 stop:3649 length:1488 start_codon:yes stop_codon:yes gene_type:complete
MAITAVTSVSVDQDEYSKFEEDRAIIEAEILVSGTVEVTDGTTSTNSKLTVEIVKGRRARDVVVLTKTIDVATYFSLSNGGTISSTTPIYVNLDTRDAVGSTDAINLIRRGKYFVRAYQTADAKATATLLSESDDFNINIITVNRMRRDWLFGLDLQASDMRTFKYNPRSITGVKLLEVSRNHKLAMFPLKYTVDANDNKFLSWDNGRLVPISTNHKEYMLPASGPSSEYITVKIDHKRLPTTSLAEELFIEEDRLDDTSIRRYINDSIDHVENTLVQVFLEPTQIVTDIDASKLTYTGDDGTIVINEDYDFIKSPVSFYPRVPGEWISIQFPFPSLLKVDQLYGAVANTRVVHINYEWIEISEPSGFTQLVPFNTELAFDYVGLIWVESLRSATPIPNFWHYNLVAGLRECPGDIIELIGRHAAIPILAAAGAAFRGGYSSQSISRDGISESVSYTSSAIYGIYSASIEDYRNWIRENLPAIKSRYRGPQPIIM